MYDSLYDIFFDLAVKYPPFLYPFVKVLSPHRLRNHFQEEADFSSKTLQALEQRGPDTVLKIIQRDTYLAAFRRAAWLGNLERLRIMEERAPDKLQEMIQANHYEAFSNAAGGGYLEILNYLIEKAPNQLQEMIKADDYRAFRKAAHKSTPLIDKMEKWFFNDRYNARKNIANYFLNFNNVFAYAESHSREFSSSIDPFVDTHLNSLRTQKNALEQREPNALFNISAEQALRSFYCLRNLIRRNNPVYRDDILFLINIPSVKALLHTEVTAHRPNELLRLAMSLDNQQAVALLLEVPAVQQLARENNYYQHEVQNGLDAHALALDRESSMRALTRGEQKRIEAAQKYYLPVTQQKGAGAIINELKKKLEARYAKNPAVIILGLDENGEPVRQILPLKIEDFDLLPLNEKQKEEALKAYYQHQDHCALRYLSKPNRWMHKDAAYVNVNPQDTSQKWSTFDEYEPLIALLYVAAIDEQTPAVDEYTVETRFERFIAELAHINRAHNWDKSRNTGKGSEEYDDLEGDRPSCYSGVKRRLFQSVLGHPLFSLFTVDKLKEELRTFARNHFKHAITKHNRQQLKAAWNDLCLGNELSEKQKLLFKSLDINSKQKEQFIATLTRKYGEEFSSDASFQTIINNAFTIPPTESHLCSSAFATTKWWDFLEPKAEFLELLLELEKKKEERLVHYPEANEQAKIIIRELTAKANAFYQIEAPTADEIKLFKTDCLCLIHHNSSALLEHRAMLGGLFAGIRQFFNALATTLWGEPSRYGFFESKTESARILDEMELGIDRLGIAAH